MSIPVGLGAFQYGRWAWDCLSWKAVGFAVAAPSCVLCAASFACLVWVALWQREVELWREGLNREAPNDEV